MTILKERVDPNGQLNLEWRPVGNTRLEIRMPRPPKEALERRQKFNEAKKKLAKMNIHHRREVEQALSAAADQRATRLAELVRGAPARTDLIETLKVTYDAYTASKATGDPDATAVSAEKYEQAMSALLDTNLSVAVDRCS